MKVRSLILGSVLMLSTTVYAADKTGNIKDQPPETAPISLAELALKSDIVAVAQVKDTDYVYAHSFPNEGSAFLKILIAYKLNNPVEEIVEVYEKGLHPNECYFENPTVLEEGRRYLVFFRLDPEDPEIYRGLAQGCALELFVTEDNRYALKYPIDGLKLADKLDTLVGEFDYHDNYAVVSDEDLTPEIRNDLLERQLIIPYQDNYKYTHGIDLTAVRSLISNEALKPRRSWEKN
jgi:hypothetical protein